MVEKDGREKSKHRCTSVRGRHRQFAAQWHGPLSVACLLACQLSRLMSAKSNYGDETGGGGVSSNRLVKFLHRCLPQLETSPLRFHKISQVLRTYEYFCV